MRLRLVLWDGGPRGTAWILGGRSEYAEKYGPVTGRLLAAGFSVVTLDWRGQGLSDRLLAGSNLGHARDFGEFQRDLEAARAHPLVAALPRPEVMLAHSMGGAIGLRALIEGFPAEAAIFSAPMWGVPVPRAAAPLVRLLGRPALRLAERLVPGAVETPFVLVQPFDGNDLTRDAAQYERLRTQLRARPELGLGGLTLGWLSAAMREVAALHRAPPPATRSLVLLGAHERVVSAPAIRRLAARLPEAELVEVPEGAHEVLIGGGEVEDRVWRRLEGFLGSV